MGFYSRQNTEQSRLTDEVYAVIQRHNGVVLGDGQLTKETKQDARSILAAIVLRADEKKIRIETSPKNEFVVARPDSQLEPGRFLALQRTWKDGDRWKGNALRLEAVDEQNPNRVALMVGPLALFAVDDIPAQLTRKQRLSAVALSQSSDDWVAQI